MSGNVNIVVDSGKMRTAARVIDSQMSIIMSCFASIRDDINDWEGDSAEAYIMNISKLLSDQPVSDTITTGSVVHNLKEYSEILNNAAIAFEKNEQKQEEKISKLRTEIFNA
jgi:hypothetical protein